MTWRHAVQPFDHDYAESLLLRVGRIPADAKPAWGTLTRDGLVAHLADALRYAMRRSPALPFSGNWFSTHIIGPLIINGIAPMPKNVKGVRLPSAPCDIEGLHALLDEYLHRVQSGDLNPPLHPFFGDIGVDKWAKLHVVHFEHHLRQFGV